MGCDIFLLPTLIPLKYPFRSEYHHKQYCDRPSQLHCIITCASTLPRGKHRNADACILTSLSNNLRQPERIFLRQILILRIILFLGNTTNLCHVWRHKLMNNIGSTRPVFLPHSSTHAITVYFYSDSHPHSKILRYKWLMIAHCQLKCNLMINIHYCWEH